MDELEEKTTGNNLNKYTMSTDDRDEFLVWVHAIDLGLVIWDMDQYLRNKMKYEELTEEQYDCYEKVREKLREIEQDHGVDTWKLMR